MVNQIRRQQKRYLGLSEYISIAIRKNTKEFLVGTWCCIYVTVGMQFSFSSNHEQMTFNCTATDTDNVRDTVHCSHKIKNGRKFCGLPSQSTTRHIQVGKHHQIQVGIHDEIHIYDPDPAFSNY